MKSVAGNHLWEEKLQIEMNSMAGNHPWEEKSANQDEFYGWEPSLGGETCKSG